MQVSESTPYSSALCLSFHLAWCSPHSLWHYIPLFKILTIWYKSFFHIQYVFHIFVLYVMYFIHHVYYIYILLYLINYKNIDTGICSSCCSNLRTIYLTFTWNIYNLLSSISRVMKAYSLLTTLGIQICLCANNLRIPSSKFYHKMVYPFWFIKEKVYISDKYLMIFIVTYYVTFLFKLSSPCTWDSTMMLFSNLILLLLYHFMHIYLSIPTSVH